MHSNTQEFGKFRSLFWPIHNYELKKLLPMLFMFFFISFNYSVLRNIKDALVIHAVGSPGAEIIPFLKFWVVIPGAILFMVVFSKLSNVLSRTNLFYVSIIPFILFFAVFVLYLYPAKETLHPTTLSISFLPDGFVAVIRIWSFSLFYTFAELWGSVALSLLFWGFANDITMIEESKRFYALFGIGANLALDFSGQATTYFANIKNKLPPNVDAMQVTLNNLITLFIVSALLVMLIYWWINRYVLTDPRFFDPTKVKKKKSKPKLSLKESFAYLLKSKYLFYIALLVLAYGISINLIEVTWKNQLKLLYPTTSELAAFMGQYSRMVAWTTIFMMLFVTGNVIRRFGWGVAAQITPMVLLVTGTVFFTLIIFKDTFEPIITNMGFTVLGVAVTFGTIQNVMSKSSKYSLFDPTKEMTYIPLDQESKVKGKAAIDVVGARLGKAGGSLILQGLIIAGGGSLAGVTPIVAIITFFVIGGWMYSAKQLSHEFAKKSAEMEKNPAE